MSKQTDQVVTESLERYAETTGLDPLADDPLTVLSDFAADLLTIAARHGADPAEVIAKAIIFHREEWPVIERGEDPNVVGSEVQDPASYDAFLWQVNLQLEGRVR